jgi:hypothetical protein
VNEVEHSKMPCGGDAFESMSQMDWYFKHNRTISIEGGYVDFKSNAEGKAWSLPTCLGCAKWVHCGGKCEGVQGLEVLHGL